MSFNLSYRLLDILVDTVITRSTSSFNVNKLYLIVYPCVLHTIEKVKVPQLSLRDDDPGFH